MPHEYARSTLAVQSKNVLGLKQKPVFHSSLSLVFLICFKTMDCFILFISGASPLRHHMLTVTRYPCGVGEIVSAWTWRRPPLECHAPDHRPGFLSLLKACSRSPALLGQLAMCVSPLWDLSSSAGQLLAARAHFCGLMHKRSEDRDCTCRREVSL